MIREDLESGVPAIFERGGDRSFWAPGHRYVAFLDILGFSDIVKESDGISELRKKIKRALTAIADFAAGENWENFTRATSFSDNIVIST